VPGKRGVAVNDLSFGVCQQNAIRKRVQDAFKR